jgi:hypothetical protein
MLDVTFYQGQFDRMARGQAPRPDQSPWAVALATLGRYGLGGLRRARA